MRIPRLHVDLPLAAGATITLPEVAAHHATRVLRLGAGDALTVFDGRGGEYDAVVARASRGVVAVEVGAHAAVDRESALDIELGQGICKGDRMDLVVQKATELGVRAILPLVCRRTMVKLEPVRAERRVAHWRAIAVHAAQQSGRTRVPEVAGVEDLDAWLARPGAAAGIVLSPHAETALDDFAPPPPGTPIRLLVGPEGGLAPDEDRVRPRRGIHRTASRAQGASDRDRGPGCARRASGAVGGSAIVCACAGPGHAVRRSMPGPFRCFASGHQTPPVPDADCPGDLPMSDALPPAKLWAGRFTEPTDALVERFTESVSLDRRLARHDIRGSIAHATMLAEVGVLSREDRDAIVRGLEAILADIEAGTFEWRMSLEDVHMNVESVLTERIGDAGKRLHTGRSRNDQVATAERLFAREAIDDIIGAVRALQRVILTIAEREADTVLPGFTHLQPAQPVTFGHHMLAWFEMLERDAERFAECRGRVNRMPLGAAALAGTPYPIDRGLTARLLGFDGLCENSLDAVSDRDFAIELASHCAIAMVHLSRMSEELVLWVSAQFGFVELGDAYCTGSSIMPQKKNPDVPELVRGKSARAIGHLNALLVLMKGQPLAYNRDNQEDKQPLFEAIDTITDCLRVFAGMLGTLVCRRERMRETARLGYTTATDLADYLVRKGVPFRDAHEAVGRAVRSAVDTGRDLPEMRLDELRAFAPVIEEDVFEVLTLEGSVAARNHPGGTAPEQVRAAITRARERLGE